MSSSSSTRLERALELYVQHQREGGAWQELLARHPDLAEVLESFLDSSGADEVSVDPAAAERLGDFRLDREVGRGGAGRVYEARQQSLDRRVALKVLHPVVLASPRALARFRRESQILARLDHPGIVRVLATGEDRGQHWMAMEFVEGDTLAVRLDSLRAEGGHHGDSLRRLVENIRSLAEALQHAHAADIVHRDVKPANILLRPTGSAVLGDFGLARDPDAPSLTQTGVVAGTPHYMAPEQVLGHSASCDARTDVWSLGATLYECISLHRAFDGPNSQQVLQSVLMRDPVDPRRYLPGLPTDLAAITQRALEKDPAARYQTAQAFADDLGAFLEMRPVSARPRSRSQRLLRLVRRRPMVGVLLLLGLITLALGTALVVQLPRIRAAAVAATEAEFEAEFQAGLMARSNGQPEPCFGHFRRAIEVRPGRPEAVIGLCLGLLKFGRWAEAMTELERGDGRGEPAPELERCRALLLRRSQRIDEAAAIDRRHGAMTTWMGSWFAAVLLHDSREYVVSRNGVAPAAEARLGEASSMLARALRLAPRPCLSLYLEQAQALNLLRTDSRHRETADALLELWPDNPQAFGHAGLLYMGVDPQRALKLCQQARELGSRNPVDLINIGIAYGNTGQRREAVASLAAAMAAPGLPDEKRSFIISAMLRNGDEAEGMPLCNDWLQRDPSSFGARRCTAVYCTVNGDHARAIELLRSCVASKPQDFVIQWELAQAQLLAGDAPLARQTLEQLALQQPDRAKADASLHFLRLKVYDAQRDAAAALAELQRWAAVRDTDAVAWRALAVALSVAEGATAAEQALAAAERADYLASGSDERYLELRAKCLDRVGRGDEAVRLRARAAALPKSSTPR